MATDPVGARITDSSTSGEEVVERKPVTPNQEGPGVIDLEKEANDILNKADVNAAIDAVELPGTKEEIGNVNWFGGSYAGADMKVVAHLYQPSENDEQLTRTEHDKNVAEVVRDAADALIKGGITQFAIDVNPDWDYSTRQNNFLTNAGMDPNTSDEAEQEGQRFILRYIYTGSNWNTFLGVAKTKQKASDIYKGHSQLAQSLADKLETMKKVQDKGSQTVVLATLQTMSVQSHREKFAVRALGHAYVKGYTRGPRTIAGSMIFTVFNEHALAELTRRLGQSKSYGERDAFLRTILPDQLPPLDLTVVFANEYGSISQLRLFGVEFINDGATYSIEDLMTENIINFVARDADPMTSHGNIALHRNQAGMANEAEPVDLSGSKLLFDDEHYQTYLNRLSLRRRFKNR